MIVKVKRLEKKDFSKIIDFTIKGMHFDRYIDSKLALRLYSRYFVYLELERATQVIAAYMDGKFVGVLIANMKDEPKVSLSLWRKIYVKVFKTSMSFTLKGGAVYDEANNEMLNDYLKKASPDGEICFFVSDPTLQGKGIGTLLLNELRKREQGKLLYLYTDSNCTYQFYERKGFEQAQKKEIQMKLGGKLISLKCFLYCKRLE